MTDMFGECVHLLEWLYSTGGRDIYTPYEGLNLANQKSWMLGVLDRKLEGSHFPFHCYLDKY